MSDDGRAGDATTSTSSAHAGPGKLILEGVLDAEDARRAVETGADAIIVSNRGGRQVDGAPATINKLPQVVEAVAGDVEVHFEGGIRSGQDVFRALALGARATYIGRAGPPGRSGHCLD